MQHKCKVTVIDKKCFNDYQEKYLAALRRRRYLLAHRQRHTVRRSVGLHQPLYLHCASGRQHYARLD